MENKRFGIKKKLLCTVIPLVLLTITALVFINYQMSKTQLIENAKNTLIKESELHAVDLTAWVNEILGNLEAVQATMEYMEQSSDEELLKYLETTTTLSPDFPFGVYGGTADGTYSRWYLLS